MRSTRQFRGGQVLVLAAMMSFAVVKSADASVVVFPLDPRGVAYQTAMLGTENVVETLKAVPALDVIDPKTVEKQIGVDLTAQAQKCEYDVFCLVEIGEILQGDQILIGHLRQRGDGADRYLELKLIVLDVLKATITEVLIWEIPPKNPAALKDATRTVARKLFAPPDVQVVWNIEPENASLWLYGDPFTRRQGNKASPFWSGVYHVQVEAEGFHPLERRVRVPRKKRGGVVTIDLELEHDPLYVAKRKSTQEVNPFDKSSRREGSGVSAQVVGAVKDPDGPPSPFLNPIAWGIVGGGAVLGVVGGVLMDGAQGRYNQLSEQARFTPGVTVTADVAMRRRDDAKGSFAAGSLVSVAGVAVMIGGFAWMIIDAVLFSADDDEKAKKKKNTSEMSRSVDDPSSDRVAADWASALYGAAR